MLSTLDTYLKKNLDDEVRIDAFQQNDIIPFYFKGVYHFYMLHILDKDVILLEIISGIPESDSLVKHIERIEKLTDQKVVLYIKTISRYKRKNLISKRIPFIIKNGQMFLPFLGLDLKKVPENSENIVKKFTFTTQFAYLYLLYHKDEWVNVTTLAKLGGFTKMTASRALKDLYSLGLVQFEIGGKTGRSKEYHRINDPEFFLQGEKYLQSPVKKIVHIKRDFEKSMVAGLESLSELSMLNSPGYSVRAIGQHLFEKLELDIVENNDEIKDKQFIELQIWGYDPQQLSQDRYVDILSLFTSMKEEKDERIMQALDEVMQGEPWYTE
ncbi:MarR family transcriptional regulator [Lacticigenium naphthae]|uniref:MarR family transcriptional regulator n=1 Tax=Lacticigenium naphthae TaxID=515351 RepID=UPI0003FFB197|nr:helix-turn-helix domain-containing protein [Lacticigenium naphthae]